MTKNELKSNILQKCSHKSARKLWLTVVLVGVMVMGGISVMSKNNFVSAADTDPDTSVFTDLYDIFKTAKYYVTGDPTGVTIANAYLAANQDYTDFHLNQMNESSVRAFFNDVQKNPNDYVYIKASSEGIIFSERGVWAKVSTGESYSDTGRGGEKYGINYENYSTTSGPNQAANEAKLQNANKKLEGTLNRNKQNVAQTKAAAADAERTTLGDLLGQLLSWVLYYIAVGLGWVLMLLMKVMLVIAVFNNFLDVKAVTEGWTIARDICNNFFIVFMMIMAVGVTLHLPNYQWRSMLPKILLAAVLINFSKMFTGILIDVSQVLMLTFASPLATVYGFNIILAAMGLPSAFQLLNALDQWTTTSNGQTTPNQGIRFIDIIAALLFAIIVTIVAIVVVAVICIVLVYRIIMLWFLVILSPLPFLASAASNIRGLAGISSEWMSNLTNMLVVGPAMMFFLFLSFMTMVAFTDKNTNILQANVGESNTTPNALTPDITKPDYNAQITKGLPPLNKGSKDEISLSGMASPNGVINFLVVTGLLVVSLMMGQKFGQAAGKFAGQAQGWLGRAAKKYSGLNLATAGLKRAQQLPGAAVRSVAGTLGTGTLGATSAVLRGVGHVPGLGWTGIGKLGELGGQWRQDVLKARRKKRTDKFIKFAKKVGVGDKGMEKWGEFTNTALGQGVKMLGTAGVAGVAGATAAAGVGALATMASGGTLAPVIAGIAATYLGGGSRLTEMLVGSTGELVQNRRRKQAESVNQKNKAAKEQTERIMIEEGTQRDQEIQNRENEKNQKVVQLANTRTIEHKKVDDADQAEKERIKEENDEQKKNIEANYHSIVDQLNNRMASIENAQVAGDISGYDKLLQDALKNNGYKSGFVDADMLDGAVEDVKKSADWKKMIDQIQAANDTRQVRIDTSDRRRRDLETQMSSRRRAAYEKINNDYTAGKDKAEKDYDLQRVAVENTYHDRVHNRINTKGNEVEVKRFEGEYEAKIKLDKAIADLEQKLAREVADIDTDATLSAEVKAQRVAAAEERTERDRKDARTAYNEEVSRVQPATAQAKPLGFLSDYLPYAHPNWVSQAAAKEASQNTARAKNAVRQLENGEDITSFEKSRFISTDDDQNETQGKFFSLLADNDKAITQAVSSLQKVIETLDDRGKLEDKQINSIVGLAKGVAAQINAGKDVSKFESIIKLINQINSDSRVDKKSVEDYATDMKPKTS